MKELDQIIISLKKSCITENVMESWDEIRRLLLVNQNKGTLPREIFEHILENIDDMNNDIAERLERLNS